MKIKIKLPTTVREMKALAKSKAAPLKKLHKDQRILFWHYHHQGLLEYHEANEAEWRYSNILKDKAKCEWPVRLTQFNRVKRIPPDLKKRTDAADKAFKKWQKVQDNETYWAYMRAVSKVNSWISNRSHHAEIERWHKRECKGCQYEGTHYSGNLFAGDWASPAV